MTIADTSAGAETALRDEGLAGAAPGEAAAETPSAGEARETAASSERPEPERYDGAELVSVKTIKHGVAGVIRLGKTERDFVAFAGAAGALEKAQPGQKFNVVHVPDKPMSAEGDKPRENRPRGDGIKLLVAYPVKAREQGAGAEAPAADGENKPRVAADRTNDAVILDKQDIKGGVKGHFQVEGGAVTPFVAFGKAGEYLAKAVEGARFNLLHMPNPRNEDERKIVAAFPADARKRDKAAAAKGSKAGKSKAAEADEEIPF